MLELHPSFIETTQTGSEPAYPDTTMDKNAINAIADIIVTGAIDFMASKANCRADDILAAICADTEFKGAARYFAELCAAGIDASPKILAAAA